MSEHSAAQPAVQRLERSRSDRMLAGVCGGLARYFGIHPAFYRVGFVVLGLIGGAGILIYLAAALVIPDEGKEDSIASAALRASAGTTRCPLIGLGIAAVAAAVLLSRASSLAAGDAAWVLAPDRRRSSSCSRRRGGAPAPPARRPAPERTPRTPRRSQPRRRRPARRLLAHAPDRRSAACSRSCWSRSRSSSPSSRCISAVESATDIRAGLRRRPQAELPARRRRSLPRPAHVRLPVGETKLTTRVDVGGLA